MQKQHHTLKAASKVWKNQHLRHRNHLCLQVVFIAVVKNELNKLLNITN